MSLMVGILQQRLERAQAEDLVQHLVADLLLLGGGQQIRLVFHDRQHRLPHFAANAVVVDAGQRLQVDPVEQLAVQRELQLLVLGLHRGAGGRILQQALLPAGIGPDRRGGAHRAPPSPVKDSTVFTLPRIITICSSSGAGRRDASDRCCRSATSRPLRPDVCRGGRRDRRLPQAALRRRSRASLARVWRPSRRSFELRSTS